MPKQRRAGPIHAIALFFFLAVFGPACSARPTGSFPTAAIPTSLPRPTATPTPVSLFIPWVTTPPLVEADYRSGQTFITWIESTGPRGELYRVYRSTAPINADNLSRAALLVETGRDSASFYADRQNIPNTTDWKPRYVDRYMICDGEDPLPEGTGLLVWTLASQDFQGAAGGTGYYAVTVTPPGGKETFDPRYTAGPVAESVADPLPVEITARSGLSESSGGHIYIQYMDLRNWNPTFHAPNPTNKYYGLDPSDPDLANALAYAYAYAVFTPTPDLCGGALPEKLPVILRLHGWKGNTSGVDYGYPDRYCAYGIYPVDVTDTWYFGFARDHDYRKSGPVAPGDRVVNYTEQRVLRMVYDLMRNPPGPSVDLRRIYVAGQSMGGTGALALAERYPNVFAAAYSSQPVVDFRPPADPSHNWQEDVALKWGTADLNLPISIAAPDGWAQPLERYDRTGVYDWQALAEAITGAKLAGRLGDEMAPFAVASGTQDNVVTWDDQSLPLLTALRASTRAWAGLVTADAHQWMYYQGLPPSLLPQGENFYKWLPFRDFTVVRDETAPGLRNLSGDLEITSTGPGRYNQTIEWSASWDAWDGAPVDRPDRWQMSFCSTARGTRSCWKGKPQTVDVTPRRLQHFVVTPGAQYDWENQRVTDGLVVAKGTVTADDHGLITVPGFAVTQAGNRLTIQPHPE